jgi:4-azaleucine resistance transporter AzlC
MQATSTIQPGEPARRLFWIGYRAVMPMMVGVAPFGLVFGALAVTVGMSLPEALGMSVLVLAGSSQFVATELIGDNAPGLIIILTTLVINLRHLLYSASLAAYCAPLPLRWRAMIAYLMTDEAYVAAMLRKQERTPYEFRWIFLGAGLNLVSFWWGTTVIGALIGSILPGDARDALGFTLPLIFTSIVVPALKDRPQVAAAASAAVTAVALNPLPNNLGLMVAAVMGIGAGLWAEALQGRGEASPE